MPSWPCCFVAVRDARIPHAFADAPALLLGSGKHADLPAPRDTGTTDCRNIVADRYYGESFVTWHARNGPSWLHRLPSSLPKHPSVVQLQYEMRAIRGRSPRRESLKPMNRLACPPPLLTLDVILDQTLHYPRYDAKWFNAYSSKNLCLKRGLGSCVVEETGLPFFLSSRWSRSRIPPALAFSICLTSCDGGIGRSS
jgi:hypothetical protein